MDSKQGCSDSQSHGCLVVLIAWLTYVCSLDDLWMLYGYLASMDARLVVRKAITIGGVGVGFGLEILSNLPLCSIGYVVSCFIAH